MLSIDTVNLLDLNKTQIKSEPQISQQYPNKPKQTEAKPPNPNKPKQNPN